MVRLDGYTSTLIVPVTQDGYLVDRVRNNLEQGRHHPGTKTKIIDESFEGFGFKFPKINSKAWDF